MKSKQHEDMLHNLETRLYQLSTRLHSAFLKRSLDGLILL